MRKNKSLDEYSKHIRQLLRNPPDFRNREYKNLFLYNHSFLEKERQKMQQEKEKCRAYRCLTLHTNEFLPRIFGEDDVLDLETIIKRISSVSGGYVFRLKTILNACASYNMSHPDKPPILEKLPDFFNVIFKLNPYYKCKPFSQPSALDTALAKITDKPYILYNYRRNLYCNL